MNDNRKILTVNYDSIYDTWLVRELSNAFSFSYVPTIREKNGEKNSVLYEFYTKKQADEQLRRLNKWVDNGGTLEFRHLTTDGLFETVADKKYGCAW